MHKFLRYVVHLYVMSLCLKNGEAARILGIFGTEAKSHYIMYGALMRELTRRGHSVTVASHFPEKEKIENFTRFDLNNTLQIPYLTVDDLQHMSIFDNLYDVIDFTLLTCESLMDHPNIMGFIKNNQYDLFVTEMFGADCFLYVGHKLGIPTVGMVSSVILPWMNDMYALQDNTAYIPMYFLPLGSKMNFFNRVYNTVITMFANILYKTHSNQITQKIAEGVHGKLPPISSVAQNISLFLANSHFSVNHVRPTVPQVVEVGGLHIPKNVPPLSKDFEKLMAESKDGVVLFTLGTFVPAESMTEDKYNDITAVLGSLKQTVLWKINATTLPPMPANIKPIEWMPQLSVLCHPKTKLFISHGGLLGVQEAAYCGVPVLGIPMFADQNMNLVGLEEKGAAIVLKYYDINKDTFSKAVNMLLNNDKYRNNMKHISKIFKDRPQHPLDAAVYWIEYVLKYNGAKHLKSAAHELTWYQYLLLDVALFIFICLALIIYTIIKVIKLLSSFIKNVVKSKRKDEHKKLS